MAIRRGSGFVVDDRMDLSRNANEDVIATDLSRRGESIPRIVNIYDQKNTHCGERPTQMLDWPRVIRQGSTVLGGDFNAYSIRWDPRCQVQRDAVFWEKVIDETDWKLETMVKPPTTGQEKVMMASRSST